MANSLRVISVKEFEFNRTDAQRIRIKVPQNLNQTLLRKVNLDEYRVYLLATSRGIKESEICELKNGKTTIGFLIPGQAILSDEQPKNVEPLFGTYSLIAANSVCQDSKIGQYTRANTNHRSANSKIDIFAFDLFYAVIWTKKLTINSSEFFRRYFVCFARNGLFHSVEAKKTIASNTLEKYGPELIVAKNKEWPDYIEKICTTLLPNANDPFLRFFYTYQIIEALMANDYSSRFSEIKLKFEAHQNTSITHLKDFIEEFQKITKEKPRIKNTLRPACPNTDLVCERILSTLNEDYGNLDFAERIYKIRNIIFHDFQRISSLKSDVSELERSLSDYLLENKLQ